MHVTFDDIVITIAITNNRLATWTTFYLDLFFRIVIFRVHPVI